MKKLLILILSITLYCSTFSIEGTYNFKDIQDSVHYRTSSISFSSDNTANFKKLFSLNSFDEKYMVRPLKKNDIDEVKFTLKDNLLISDDGIITLELIELSENTIVLIDRGNEFVSIAKKEWKND